MELDHLFICADSGAPEGSRMLELGFEEGTPNTHAGQGTANRRFFFANGMIELLWVSDAEEAQREPAARTQLWSRWCQRRTGASPFGIIARPVGSRPAEQSFPGWEYRPDWLPKDLVVHVGDAGIEEPMWVYMDFLKPRQNEVKHPNGVRDITAITLTTPTPLRSAAARLMIDDGVFVHRTGGEQLVTIEFDHVQGNRVVDLRPDLPVILRYRA